MLPLPGACLTPRGGEEPPPQPWTTATENKQIAPAGNYPRQRDLGKSVHDHAESESSPAARITAAALSGSTRRRARGPGSSRTGDVTWPPQPSGQRTVG